MILSHIFNLARQRQLSPYYCLHTGFITGARKRPCNSTYVQNKHKSLATNKYICFITEEGIVEIPLFPYSWKHAQAINEC